MKRTDKIKLDALSKIDDDIIEKNTEKRIHLKEKQKKRKNKIMKISLASVASFVLVVGILLSLIPMLLNKGVPVYQGMTLSDVAPIVNNENATLKAMPDSEPIRLLSRIEMVDHDDDDDDEDDDDDDDHQRGDNEQYNSTLTFNSEQGVYYAQPNQDIYITVHISNPSKYEILSFTLNGVKYSSYMFEEGSDLENLVLKYNVGDVMGRQEYTIDEIKYVDGEKIKNVKMEGDKTVRVMVTPADLVKFDNLEATVDFELIKQSFGIEGFNTLGLYENGALVKEIDVGTGKIGSLPFDKKYMLIGKYTSNGEEKTFECEFLSPKTSSGLLIVDGMVAGIGNCTDSVIYINLPVADNAFMDLDTQIKEVYFGEKVTSIGANAFARCSKLEVVQFSNTLTEIGSDAFSDCPLIKSIAYPNSLKSIGSGAFDGCSSLNAIHISSIEDFLNITYNSSTNPLSVAKNLYLNGTLVTELVVPETVKELKESALFGCTSITRVVLPEGFEKIGSFAFCGCTALESITLPEGIKKIDAYTFSGCTALKEITIPGSVEIIGMAAFNASGIEKINFNEGLLEIDDRAFVFCSSLQRVVLPEGLEVIGDSAFSCCTSLKEIILPSTLVKIEKFAFENTAIEEMIIPKSVLYIYEHIFNSCHSLETLKLEVESRPEFDYWVYSCIDFMVIENIVWGYKGE